MQQLLRYINSDAAGRAAELSNLWSLLAALDQQSYIVRATGGPGSAARAPAGQEIGTAISSCSSGGPDELSESRES